MSNPLPRTSLRPTTRARISVRTGMAGLLLALTLGCTGRPRSWAQATEPALPAPHGPVVLEFDLGKGAPESGKGLLGLPSPHTFDSLVSALDRLRSRDQIAALFLNWGVGGIGWARAHELADGLLPLRQRNIPIVCHADAWDNPSYAAAVRACSVISLSPGGVVELTGPSATTAYARELLVDKLDAQVDILQVGKFKGAAEPLTRDGPSEEFRTSIEEALGATRREYERALQTRGLQAHLGRGPFGPHEAKTLGLVDEILDVHGSRQLARARSGNAKVHVVFGRESSPKSPWGDLMRALTSPSVTDLGRPHVRLVRLHGEIVLDQESSGIFGGHGGVVARKLVERARALAEDNNVRAVVLRIDSPGGSALGSDLAWIALEELRRKKPVIVSVGEMAASGGYYLASVGHVVFAEPESLLGSIGVVGGKVSFGKTLAKAGIHTASFGDVRAARLSSIVEPWDDDMRSRLTALMVEIYELFLRRVAEGRNRPRETFEAGVEGRVFGAERAIALGLVDRLGGLGTALNEARSRAGLPESAPVVVDEPGTLLDVLSEDGLGAAAGAATTTLASSASAMDLGHRDLLALKQWVGTLASCAAEGSVAAILPVPLVVR